MKNEFRDSNDPSATHNDSLELNALLQKSRVALANLQQAYNVCEQHLAVAQKELATYVHANAFLQHKLTEVEKNAADASYLAYYDALTGLSNRRLLLDRLNQAIAQAARQKKCAALMYFDVDGFKKINESLGRAGGDKLLQGVAERLTTCLRATDTACRYGGTEFIILLPEIDNLSCVAAVEQKIRGQLTKAYLIENTTIRLTISIGVAVYPVHAKDHGDLIRIADAAMYHSKPKADMHDTLTNNGT